MISWPAIIRYTGDYELVFIQNTNALNSYANTYRCTFESGDHLIDSAGRIYRLDDMSEVSHLSSETNCSLDELTELVRLHASELGNCCISKIVFPSIPAAIESVASIKDQH